MPLDRLAGESFILYKRPGAPGLYDTIIGACRGAGFSPKIDQEAPLTGPPLVSSISIL